MTFLGKLLTVLNVVLSLGILAVALASFTNPVDFSDNAPKEGNPPGLFKVRSEKIRDAWERVPPALLAVAKAQKGLETLRFYDDAHVFFKAELKKLETDATKDDPVQVVKYNGALPEIDPTKAHGVVMEPLVENGKPVVLKSIAFYEAENKRLLTEIPKAQDRFLAAAVRDVEETTKRLPHKDKGGVDELGLHLRMTAAEFKVAQAREEYARIAPLWINAHLEAEQAQLRRAALEARLAELKKLDKGR